jgi:hypothetical protein
MKKVLYFAILVSLAISCESPEISPVPSPDQNGDKVLNYLRSLGFRDEDIRDAGSFYVVEDDIRYSKNYPVPDDAAKGATGSRSKQFFGALASAANAKNIRVFIHSSMSSMTGDISSAIGQWNSAINSGVRFNFVTSGSFDLTIVDDPSIASGGFCGLADPPGGGDVGGVVRIDKATVQFYVAAQRRALLVHEIGHAIGFRHTDWQAFGEHSASAVPGVGGTDGSSIMNRAPGCNNLPTVLSTKDKLAVAALYPVPEEELYIVKSGTIYAVDQTTGMGLDINTGWDNTEAMTGLSGFIYSVTADVLYQINPNNNSAVTFSDYPAGWSGTEAMTSISGALYLVHGGTLYQITVSNGDVASFSDYPTGWSGTEAMAANSGAVYVVQAGTLYQITISNGDVTSFSDYPTGWSNTEAMTAYGSNLYIVQGGTLYQVNINTGDVVSYSDYPTGWSGTLAMIARSGYLFISQGGTLWKVDLSTGGVSPLGPDNWSGTEAMSANL